MEISTSLFREIAEKIQSLERKLEERLSVMKEQLDEKLPEMKKQLEEKLSEMKEKLDEKLSEMKEQLEDQSERITKQLETKLRRLERQLQHQNNLVKWELLAELMILEQNQPLASRNVTLINQETQTTEETPHSTIADAEVPEEPHDVGVQVDPLPREEMWEVCGVRRYIHSAVCRRETAVVIEWDGIMEVYSSGKVVGRYLELEGEEIQDVFCSDEYIGVWLENNSIACFRWFSDRLEWLYCLYVEGQTWRKAELTDVPSEIEDYSYRQARDTVCCLYGDRVSIWSLSKNKTFFNIKVHGAEYLHMTPDLVLVEVSGNIEVFTLEGGNLYSIQGAVEGPCIHPPLTNTDYTALVSTSFESINIWPTTSGQPVTKISSFDSALHPHLPLVCSSVKGEPWELVVRDVTTNSVVWRRPQSGPYITVSSIDAELLLIKPRLSSARILRWASGEVVATLPVAGCYKRTASPQYIISSEQVLYRELT